MCERKQKRVDCMKVRLRVLLKGDINSPWRQHSNCRLCVIAPIDNRFHGKISLQDKGMPTTCQRCTGVTAWYVHSNAQRTTAAPSCADSLSGHLNAYFPSPKNGPLEIHCKVGFLFPPDNCCVNELTTQSRDYFECHTRTHLFARETKKPHGNKAIHTKVQSVRVRDKE